MNKNIKLSELEVNKGQIDVNEIWMDSIEKNYQVSSFGRIKSIAHKVIDLNGKRERTFKGRILKPKYDKKKYQRIMINNKTYLLHRLIALSFIENKYNKPQINHIDGNPSNNKIENLEWVTNSENNLHSYKYLNRKHSMIGRYGKLHHRSKKVNQYDNDDKLLNEYASVMEAARNLNLNFSKIAAVCRGKRKHTGGYKFKYAN